MSSHQRRTLDQQTILKEMDIPQWVLKPQQQTNQQNNQETAEALQDEINTSPAAAKKATENTIKQNPSTQNIGDMDWQTLEQTVSHCTLCRLCESRQQTVFGSGDQQAKLLLVGEAPGATEDQRGAPFLGAAGQLLDKMLAAIQLHRDTIYIANTIKCRPPDNRNPTQDELSACSDYLTQQIKLLQPKIILALGKVAAQQLTGLSKPLGAMRGDLHQHQASKTPVLVSYHPAYLLRSPGEKRKAWEDLQRLQGLLKTA